VVIMRLIADCGNSTVKLALMHEGGVWLHERLVLDPAAWTAWIEPHAEMIDELVLLPTGRSTGAVRAWWQGPLRVIGVDIAVPEVGQYPGFGLDRLCAGLAATAQERCDVLVVDCGTACTLTAWRQDGPHLLGGLILPGAAAWIAGLAAAAPALPVTEPHWVAPSVLARTPAEAIATAVGIGFPAALTACLERLHRDTHIVAVVSTGGAAVPLLGGALNRRGYRPSLVCEGAEILARRDSPEVRRSGSSEVD